MERPPARSLIGALLVLVMLSSILAASVADAPVPLESPLLRESGGLTAPPALTLALQPTHLGVQATPYAPSYVVFYGTVDIQQSIYLFSTVMLSATCTWIAQLNKNAISFHGAGEGAFNVTVTVPAGARPNEVGTLIVTATMSTPQGIVTSSDATSTMTVLPYNLARVQSIDPSDGIEPGHHVTLRAILINSGTEDFTFALRLGSPPSGFEVVVPISRFNVPGGGTREFTVEVQVPRTAESGHYVILGYVNLVEPNGDLGEAAGSFDLQMDVTEPPVGPAFGTAVSALVVIVVVVAVAAILRRRRRRARKDLEALEALETLEALEAVESLDAFEV